MMHAKTKIVLIRLQHIYLGEDLKFVILTRQIKLTVYCAGLKRTSDLAIFGSDVLDSCL